MPVCAQCCDIFFLFVERGFVSGPSTLSPFYIFISLSIVAFFRCLSTAGGEVTSLRQPNDRAGRHLLRRRPLWLAASGALRASRASQLCAEPLCIYIFYTFLSSFRFLCLPSFLRERRDSTLLVVLLIVCFAPLSSRCYEEAKKRRASSSLRPLGRITSQLVYVRAVRPFPRCPLHQGPCGLSSCRHLYRCTRDASEALAAAEATDTTSQPREQRPLANSESLAACLSSNFATRGTAFFFSV